MEGENETRRHGGCARRAAHFAAHEQLVVHRINVALVC
jgi:hypothetical protein